MKKNCLYTINPWNRNMFLGGGGLGIGNTPITGNATSVPKTNINVDVDALKKQTDRQYNKMRRDRLLSQIQPAGAGLIASSDAILDYADPLWHVAGNRHSAAGDSLGSMGKDVFKAGVLSGNPALMLAGAAGKVGGDLINIGWGYGIENEKDVKNNINTLLNTQVTAKDNNSLAKQWADAKIGTVGLGKVSNGIFTDKGTKIADDLKWQQKNAVDFAIASYANAGENIRRNQLSDNLATYSALGGPLALAQPYTGALGLMQQNRYIDAIDRRTDAIAKVNNNNVGTFRATANRFDDGGFVNSFMQDPIQAAMQYIQERDAEDAAAEAQAEAAAQQAAYDDMQQRLAAAETQNQGLQAMIESQGLDIKNMMEAQRQNNYADGWQGRMLPAPNDDAMMAKLRRSLSDRGISKRAHQDAIIANIMVESGGNPNAKNSKSSARGMLQWLTPRYPKAWDYESQMDHIANTYNQYGGDNWLDRKALDEFMNTNDSTRAAQLFRQYYERPEAHTYKWTDKYINQMYRDNKAFGGELGTNGTDFTNGLLEINAGGSHEDNAYGGVLMGYDYEGVPNFVEEGETVFNDYVYSNRLTVPDFMHKELGLGGSKKALTFADASKILAKDSVERPNNPIDQAGLMASLGKLAQIQETERARIQAEDMNTEMEEPMGLMAAYGGNLFVTGGNTNNPVSEMLARRQNQSLIRQIFGNTQLASRLENIGQAVSDPIGYFAGDEIDAVMSKLSSMTEPQLDRFFNTSAGRVVANIIDSVSSGAPRSNAQEAGVRSVKQAWGRVAKPVANTIIRSAKRATARSNQFRTNSSPMARGKNPAIQQGIERAQAAKKAAETAAYNARIGEKGFKPTNRSTSTTATERFVKTDPIGGVGVARATRISKLNKNVGRQGKAFKESVDPYAGLEGTLDLNVGSNGLGKVAAGAAGLVAAGTGVTALSQYLNNNLVDTSSKPAYGTSPSGLHMRVINGRPEYRAKDGKYYKSEQNALAINAGKKLTTREKAAEAAASRTSQREALQRNEAQAQAQAQAAPSTAQRTTIAAPRATTAQQSAPSRAVGNAGARGARNAQAATPQNSGDERRKGDIVGYKYDWYRNGDDGTGRHWGFTPNENGIIDKNTGYTDEYRKLVQSRGANDIRKWAADKGWKPGMTDFTDIKDPSLKSFLQNNGSAALENLKDEDWQKGALDGRYGFMHHVAAEIGANPQDLPTAEEYNRAIGEGGDYVNDNNPFRIVGMSRIGQQTPSMEWGRDEYGNRLRLVTPAESTDTPTATDNSPSGIRGEVVGGGRPTYATWMRYAPIFGTGMMALSDALGLTNRPDYTYANKLEAAANRAGIAPNIEAPAIGDYMRYDPFDRLFYANQLQANARATDRSIENNAGMNRGTALAAQIANGYNTNLNLGNLDRQGDEYNRGQYERKKEYDRRTNLINAQMQLEADMANARFAQQASSANLSGLAQAAAMRDAIDQRVGAARSANITNFLNNMGNLGRENFAFNQINWDRSRRYGARKNGVSYYWPSNNITAFGGEIEKMKRNKKNKR